MAFIPNRALRILLITDCMVWLASAMIGPIYAIFVEQIRGNVMDAGITGGIYALAAGLTTIVSGAYSDRIKKSERVIVLGYVLVGFTYLLFTLVDSMMSLLMVQTFLGISAGVYAPVYKAIYSRNLDENKECTGWSFWEASTYFAIAGGASLGGFLAYFCGFNAVFVTMAALCFASAACLHILSRHVFLNLRKG